MYADDFLVSFERKESENEDECEGEKRIFIIK